MYPVQIITSEVTIRCFWQKQKKKKKKKNNNKKKKKKKKKNKNKRTFKNKIINSTPIIVFTYYFGHISYYLFIFLLCPVSVFPWYQLKYTKFRNGGLVVGFAIFSDGYF